MAINMNLHVKDITLKALLLEQYQRFYLLDELQIKRLRNQIDVFIDIGCSFGAASKLALECGCKQVYAFEPNEALGDLFMENVAHHYPGQVKLFRTKTVTRKYGDGNHSVEDILRNEMRKNIFLKITVNGDEYALLSELDNSMLLQVPKWIVGEYHLTSRHGFNINLLAKAQDFFNNLKRKTKMQSIEFPDKIQNKPNLLGQFINR